MDVVKDDITDMIDRVFDFTDRVAEAGDRLLNRKEQTEEKLRPVTNRMKRAEVIDTTTADAPKPPKPPKPTTPAKSTPSMAITTRAKFRIVEEISPSGAAIFVVTDGGNARTEVTTRALAERLLRALEVSS